MKICSKCGEAKPLEGFNRNRRAKDGRYAYCRECANAHSRGWRAQNLERVQEYNRCWHEDNREQRRGYNQRWTQENLEQRHEYRREWRERNFEQQRDYNRRWAEENRGRRAAAQHKRRALVDQKLTQDDQGYIKILRQDPCAYCGETGGVIDHIDPLAKGGTVDWTNLTAACNSCNARKHTASLLDLLARSPAR